MRILLGLVVMVLFFSCKSLNIIQGEYGYLKKDFEYRLVINNDSTFNLYSKSIHAKSGCDGKWKLLGDTLFLNCFEESFPAEITQGYMTERKKRVIILQNNKLQIDNLILRKIK